MPFTLSKSVTTLCGRNAAEMAEGIRVGSRQSLVESAIFIIAGCGLYGFAVGLWRAPLQGGFVAVKMPLLIFVTLLMNGAINGMMAQVLGSGLSFRQTLTAILQSFAVFSLIIGSLSPLALFLTVSVPGPESGSAFRAYPVLLLTHTGVIAYAGIVANVRLRRTLEAISGSASTANRVLFAWLAGNLFVGAQISYILRPFFGQPRLPVQFVRPNPFEGNFYESVWRSARSLVGGMSESLALGIGGALIAGSILFLLIIRSPTRNPNSNPNSP